MRRRWLVVVVVLALAGASCAGPGASFGRSVALRDGCTPGDVSAAVLRVHAGDFEGTAFHIGGGEFVTAAHVVATVPEVDLIGEDGAQYHARVVTVDSTSDLALLRMDEGDPPPAAAAWAVDSALLQGDPLTAYVVQSGGLKRVPLTMIDRLTFGGMQWLSVRETASPLIPGDSGAPVVDRCGDVVGLVQAGDLAEGTAVALSATSARLALESAVRAPGGRPAPGAYETEAQRVFGFSDCGGTEDASARWKVRVQLDESGWVHTSYSPTGGRGFVGHVDTEGALVGSGVDYSEAWTGTFHENGSADLWLSYRDSSGCTWVEQIVIHAP